MKTYLLSFLMAMGFLPLDTATDVSFPDAPAAREQAKQEGKPVLILWHGSDWMAGSATLNAEWQKLATDADNALPVIFGQYDEKVGTTEEQRKKAAMPFSEFNLPVAVLLAPDGTFMASYRGKTVRSAAEMQKAVKATLANLAPFTELVQQARTTQGKESAAAAGKALSLLNVADASRHPELIKIINERDPKDETGYRSMFCYEHMGMYKLINDMLKGGPEGKLRGAERRFDEAEAFVRNILSRKGGTQPQLATEQQQQWMTGLYYVQKERMRSLGTKDVAPVLATLQSIVELDPESNYGIGAAAYHRYWNPNSFFEVRNFFYDASHQSHGFEKDWHVDVTEKVTGPATYVFRLVPYAKGAMVTRNYRLIINGQQVATASVGPQANVKEVEFTIPELHKDAKVEVWLTAQCNDHWLNCSGSIQMLRK